MSYGFYLILYQVLKHDEHMSSLHGSDLFPALTT